MPFSCLGYQYEIQYSPGERKHSLSLLDDELCSSSSSPLGNLTHSVARLGRAEAGPLLSVKRRALEKMPASVWPLARVLYLPQTNQTKQNYRAPPKALRWPHWFTSVTLLADPAGSALSSSWVWPGTPSDASCSRLPSVGSHRVGHDWSDLAAAAGAAADDFLASHVVLVVKT